MSTARNAQPAIRSGPATTVSQVAISRGCLKIRTRGGLMGLTKIVNGGFPSGLGNE